MTARRTLVVAALALALVAAVVWWWRGRGDDTRAAGAPAINSSRAVAAPVLNAGGGTGAPSTPDLGPRHLPPPPPDFHDPNAVVAPPPTGAERKLAAGEFPLRPPGFASDADRAKFRAWWLDEYARRTRIYREHNPSDTYPSDEDTDRMLERLYDLGEPPRPGETAEDLDVRQEAWFQLWSDLTAAFGTPPKTIISFGGDPQYGTGAPPPVLPPGAQPPGPDPTRPTMPASEVPTTIPPLGPAGPREPRR
jgi:hypothetical protein